MVNGNAAYFKKLILPTLTGMYEEVMKLCEYSSNFIFEVILLDTICRVCPFNSRCTFESLDSKVLKHIAL